MLDKKISITLKDFVSIILSVSRQPEPVFESWAEKVQKSDSDTIEAVHEDNGKIRIIHYNSKNKEAQNEEALN